MPSAAWLAAANKKLEPVLALSIESVDAINVSIYDRAGWEAGPVLTNVVTDSPLDDPGTVIMATDGDEIHSGTYFETPYIPGGSRVVSEIEGTFAYSSTIDGVNGRVTGAAFTVYFLTGGRNCGVTFQGKPDGGEWVDLLTIFHSSDVTETHTINVTQGIWQFRMHGATDNSNSVILQQFASRYQTSYLPTAYMETTSVDLGETPTANSVISIRDHSSEIATLNYTAEGSNTDSAPWTDLGAVVDGASVAPYRYYRFSASFTSTGPETPILREIGVTGGNSQVKVYSTHEDIPAAGARPYLNASIGALNSKIELMKLGTIGEVSPRLFLLEDTFNLLRDGYLRNKTVQLRHGFLGLAATDYEPIFTGFWYDGSVDFDSQTISVKTRSVFSRFAKVKLPPEKATAAARDDLTCPPWERINANIITTMLDLVEAMGYQDRYIDRPSFETLAAGVFAGDNWKVSRRIDKDAKEEGAKLLEELSVLSGCFLLQQPDGKIRAAHYDPTAAIVAEITPGLATFSTLDLGQADLFTRQQILYNPRRMNDIDDGVARGSWLLGKVYAVGDMIITLAGDAYNCIEAHTSGSDSQPGIGTAWEAYWAAGTVPGALPWEWAAGMDFDRGDTIYRAGVLYRCLQAHQSSSAVEPAVGSARRAYWATEWISGTAYELGDVVTMQGPLATCIDGHTADADTTPITGINYRSVWHVEPVKKSTSDEDFYNAFVKINNTAEVNWGLNEDVEAGDPEYQKKPGYQKTWQEKWNATDYAREQLANRMDSWFANPKMKIKASDLPPHFRAVQLGSMVGVSGLKLPIAGAEWDTPCNNTKFMVTSTTFDPAACTVSLDLLEV